MCMLHEDEMLLTDLRDEVFRTTRRNNEPFQPRGRKKAEQTTDGLAPATKRGDDIMFRLLLEVLN